MVNNSTLFTVMFPGGRETVLCIDSFLFIREATLLCDKYPGILDFEVVQHSVSKDEARLINKR